MFYFICHSKMQARIHTHTHNHALKCHCKTSMMRVRWECLSVCFENNMTSKYKTNIFLLYNRIKIVYTSCRVLTKYIHVLNKHETIFLYIYIETISWSDKRDSITDKQRQWHMISSVRCAKFRTQMVFIRMPTQTECHCERAKIKQQKKNKFLKEKMDISNEVNRLRHSSTQLVRSDKQII